MIIFSISAFFIFLIIFVFSTSMTLANGVRIATGNISKKFVKITKTILILSGALMIFSLISFATLMTIKY